MIPEKDKYTFKDSLYLRFERDDTYYKVGDLRGFKARVSQEVEDYLGLDVEVTDVFKDRRLIYTVEGESTKGYKFEEDSEGDIDYVFMQTILGIVRGRYKGFKMVIKKEERGEELRFEYVGRIPEDEEEDASVELFRVDGEFYRTISILYPRKFRQINDATKQDEEAQDWVTFLKTEEQLRAVYPKIIDTYKNTFGLTDRNLEGMEFNVGYTKLGNSTKTRKPFDINDVESLVESIREMEGRDDSRWDYPLNVYVRGVSKSVKNRYSDVIRVNEANEYRNRTYYREEINGVTSLTAKGSDINSGIYVIPEDVEELKEEKIGFNSYYTSTSKRLFDVLSEGNPIHLYHAYDGSGSTYKFKNFVRMNRVEDIEEQLEEVQKVVTQASRYHGNYAKDISDISFIVMTSNYVEGSDDVIDVDTIELHETAETNVEDWGFTGLLERMMTGENVDYSQEGYLSEVNGQIDELHVYTRFTSTELEEQEFVDYPIMQYKALVTGSFFVGVTDLPYVEEKKISLLDIINSKAEQAEQEEDAEEVEEVEDAIGEINEVDESILEVVEPEQSGTISLLDLQTTIHAEDASSLPERLEEMEQEELELDNEEDIEEEIYYTFEEVEKLVEEAYQRGYVRGLESDITEEEG